MFKHLVIGILTCIPVAVSAEIPISLGEISSQLSSFEAGVICAPDSVDKRAAPNTIAGTTNIIDAEPPFISTQYRVPAVVGVGFGVKSLANDSFGITGVKVVVTHPPMGPDKITKQSFVSSISGRSRSLTFYQFDYDYELVAGQWHILATKDGEILYDVSFEVTNPLNMPELASACGFQNLFS